MANPNYTAPSWTEAENALLLLLREQGVLYRIIATEHLPNRTKGACKNQHEKLLLQRAGRVWQSQAEADGSARVPASLIRANQELAARALALHERTKREMGIAA